MDLFNLCIFYFESFILELICKTCLCCPFNNDHQIVMYGSYIIFIYWHLKRFFFSFVYTRKMEACFSCVFFLHLFSCIKIALANYSVVLCQFPCPKLLLNQMATDQIPLVQLLRTVADFTVIIYRVWVIFFHQYCSFWVMSRSHFGVLLL